MTQTSVLRPGVAAVPANLLQPHPANPRQGDVSEIAELINENGWHGVVVAQASTGRILAGNHRYKAATMLYAEQGSVPGMVVSDNDPVELLVPVHALDVDDDEALRILLGDNRASDLATYDEPMLLRLVAQVGDADSAVAVLTDPNSTVGEREEALKVLKSSEYAGTGYSTQDVAQIAMGLMPETLSEDTYRTPEDMAEQYANTDVRQIMLIAGIGDYETLLVALRKVREDNGFDDNTEAVFWLMEQAGLVRKTNLGWAPA